MNDRDAGYRTGRRVGNTLYLDGVFIGSCITPEIAAELVTAANRGRQEVATDVASQRRPITAANVKLGDSFESEGKPRTVSSVQLTPDGDVEIGFADGPSARLRPDDEVMLGA